MNETCARCGGLGVVERVHQCGGRGEAITVLCPVCAVASAWREACRVAEPGREVEVYARILRERAEVSQ